MARRRPSPLLLFFPICGLAAIWGRRSDDTYAGNAAGKTPLERAMEAVKTEDPAKMRAVARQLRAEGETTYADGLERAADMIAKMKTTPRAQWPAGADPVDEPWLRDEPVPDQTDLMVADWLQRPDNGAPALTTADLYPDRAPTRRLLTPRERWALAPYFPVPDDLSAELRFERPPNWTDEQTQQTGVYAVTYGIDGQTVVYFPHGPRLMLSRFWLAVLAHELVHGAQLRVAGGETGSIDAMAKYGYQNSPIEVQARYYQRIVYADLVTRARAYYLARGGIPVFPLQTW